MDISEEHNEVDTEMQVKGNNSPGNDDAKCSNTSSVESEVRNDETNDMDMTDLQEPAKVKLLFKKPVGLMVGPRRGKIAGKVRVGTLEPVKSGNTSTESDTSSSKESSSSDEAELPAEVSKTIPKEITKPSSSPAQKITENLIPIPYLEPKWGGYPKHTYSLEILKSGKVLEHYDLSTKSFTVIGRLPNCDITLLHPTISRHHAVLQYRVEDTKENPPGFYLYDLDSTHGTFLNKNRVKPNIYIRLHVGHVLKLGCSTRLFVLHGPSDDEEAESELSVTQIQLQRQNEMLRRRLDKLGGVAEEEEGISWGMGEDAEEETDLTINPFASTNNEELYLDDPKKTLRGWFEREGQELVYDVEEKGVGQFLCQVELPVDCARGGTVVAEAMVKGKKKEAVVQCALEACRILDRYGLLRQATHESRKRKAKDWEAEDFYDSDDDTFLDRTGAVEEKRKQRMKQAGQQEVLTYKTAVEKHEALLAELHEAESRLHEVTSKDAATKREKNAAEDEDELDAFMSNLSSAATDKVLVSKLKATVARLKTEESRSRNLVNLARPANLPELKPPSSTSTAASTATITSKMTAIYGKARKLVKNKLGQATKTKPSVKLVTVDDEDDEEGEDDVAAKRTVVEEVEEEEGEEREEVTGNRVRREREGEIREERVREGVEKVRKDREGNEEDVKVYGVTGMLTSEGKEEEEDDEEEERAAEVMDRNAKKRQKKNKKRMQQRTAKMNKRLNAIEAADPEFSDWTPPVDQSGDGRTSLNDKLGY